ncbi:uncharacterized protein LOC129568769 isoform X2 [Sitodiplosis mosellana]|uniref:uncharacterized protein LOC129568769 isoform X2 n=1 Tax=Sitodiplosis mosellana TaxID=263140 RepID=UPI002444B84B|nr:uncharacterized protein LOC129568769 isoform X2 [Sitodiplosis mosellana]
MASYWQGLKKPLTSSGLMNTKLYSTAIVNKEVKSATSSSQAIHLSAKQNYPQAEPLPLPINIDPNESMRFSPQRARDITSNTIATNIWNARSFDITIDSSKYDIKSDADPHVGSYDCTGAVSLNSSMQSNVPSPFGGMHNYTHLNMPGGQWAQCNKWMSHDLHSSHYTNLRREVRNNMLQDEKSVTLAKAMWMRMSQSNVMRSSFACLSSINHYSSLSHLNVASNQTTHRMFSDKKDVVKTDELNKENETKTPEEPVALTARAKLKNAIKDYGSTVLVFHIAISLVSLGIFYQLVNSGLDMVAILEYLGLGSTSSTITNNVASGASTFVVAYAIHKVFAPFRISITLVSAPFIVRYLRNKGILSMKPKIKKQ